jgi:A/G-specific adenine glycosylase
MMDLGASVCRPKSPLCHSCPVAGDCRAFALGTPEAFPPPKVRKARPRRHGLAYWVERDGCVWLVRRPAKGMLGGMTALPGPDWQNEPGTIAITICVRHVFTHFVLDLAVVPKAEPEGEGWWQPIDLLGDAGLPTLYRRAADAVIAGRSALAA